MGTKINHFKLTPEQILHVEAVLLAYPYLEIRRSKSERDLAKVEIIKQVFEKLTDRQRIICDELYFNDNGRTIEDLRQIIAEKMKISQPNRKTIRKDKEKMLWRFGVAFGIVEEQRLVQNTFTVDTPHG